MGALSVLQKFANEVKRGPDVLANQIQWETDDDNYCMPDFAGGSFALRS